MAATFLRLKATILANRMREALARPQHLFVVAVLFVIFFGSRAASSANSVTWLFDVPEQPDLGEARTVAVALLLTAAWLVLPLLGSRRASLPVAPMVVLPLRPAQMAVGLFVSGLLGLGALVTAGVLGTWAAAFYDDATALAVAVVAALALTVQLLVLGRMVATVSEVIARTHRPRLFFVASTLVVALVGLLAFVAADRALGGEDTSGAIATIGAWVPPSMIARAAVEAASGDSAVGIGLIAAGSVFTVVSWALWVWLIGRRIEMGAPASVTHRVQGDPFARFARAEPQNRLGAIAARERAMLFRSPVALASMVIYVGLLGFILAALFASALPDGYAPLGALAFVFPLIVRRVNQVAARARSRWISVVTPGPRWADVAGYDVAVAPFDLTLIVGAVVVIAGVTDSWEIAFSGALLGIAVWLIGQATIHVTSFRLAVAPSWDATADDDASKPSLLQTMATGLLLMIALIPVIAVIVLAVVDDGVLALYVAVPSSLVYGAALYALTLWWTASWLDRHEAELQAQLRV